MLSMPPASFHLLSAQGVLLLEGPDAPAFLHGQVTADVLGLVPGHAALAALCNAQGRVIATLRIGRLARGLALVMPRELTAPVAQRLQRYVLRAKVSVQDASGELAVVGLAAGGGGWQAPAAGWESLRLDGMRSLAIGPAASADAALDGADPMASWDALCVASGEPEVYAATSEAWVPQMLNLDLLGAVSLSKGCYTGQEVVARVQYLGRSRRRMLRYAFAGAGEPVAGSSMFNADTEAGRVVRSAVQGGAGELLAVVGTEFAGLALTDAARNLTCTPRSLPYALPQAAGAPPD